MLILNVRMGEQRRTAKATTQLDIMQKHQADNYGKDAI